MSPENAETIFAGVIGIGVFVWLVSLRAILSIGREKTIQDKWDVGNEALHDERGVAGQVVVPGDGESLSKALCRSLLNASHGVSGAAYKIEERSPKRVLVEKRGALVCNQQPSTYFSEACFHLTRIGENQVQVDYSIGFERVASKLRKSGLAVVLGLGLPCILITATLIWTLVVGSNNEAVRWQVLQSLQIIHVLWPPFLFVRLYNAGRTQSKIYIENLLESLAYSD